VEDFWDFAENKIGDYIFTDFSLVNSKGEVDISKLTTFNTTK
jgi:hypothetical protein